MPDSEWHGLLAAAAAEVLETMFFASVYGPPQAGADRAGPRMAARVGFAGTPNGVLTLSISTPAMRALAANFLASDDGDPLPVSQLEGVICELANMICGALLSQVKAAELFRLTSPELLPDDAPCPPFQPHISLALGEDAGDGTIDLWFDLEPHAD